MILIIGTLKVLDQKNGMSWVNELIRTKNYVTTNPTTDSSSP
jgi:hypothetical protein